MQQSGLLFAWITAAMQWRRSVCGPADALWILRVLWLQPSVCVAGPGVLDLLLRNSPKEVFSMGFMSGEFTGQSRSHIIFLNPWIGTVGREGRCQTRLENEFSSTIKNQQKQTAWLSKSSLTVGILPLSLHSLDLHCHFQSMTLWFPKTTFIWLEGFGPLSNMSVFVVLSPGKTPLMFLLVQEGLDTRNATGAAHDLDPSARGGPWSTGSGCSPRLAILPLSPNGHWFTIPSRLHLCCLWCFLKLSPLRTISFSSDLLYLTLLV